VSVRRWVWIIALFAALAVRVEAAEQQDIWQRVGFDQHIGAVVPVDASLRDEHGGVVTLRHIADGKPLVLVLNQYDCPNLCSTVLDGAFEALGHSGLVPGRDFAFAALSIDPNESAAIARSRQLAYLQRFGLVDRSSAVRFLTAPAESIDAITSAVGFRYVYDTNLRQYAHAAGLVILAPDGRVDRYLFGARFPAIGMRLALVDASQGKLGSLTDQVWLLCYHYDPQKGRYGLAIVRILQVLGSAVALAVAGLVFSALRRERHARRSSKPAVEVP
jgi:protein SCO1/2